jgi:hypothetical protein
MNADDQSKQTVPALLAERQAAVRALETRSASAVLRAALAVAESQVFAAPTREARELILAELTAALRGEAEVVVSVTIGAFPSIRIVAMDLMGNERTLIGKLELQQGEMH